MTSMTVTVNFCVLLSLIEALWLCERWQVSWCRSVWDSVWAVSVSLSLCDLVFLIFIASSAAAAAVTWVATA